MTTGAPAAEAEGREPDDAGGLTGRGGWHLVAFLAALALVLAMTVDWYTTEQGEEYRRIEEVNRDREDPQRLDSDDVERAAQAAEAEEKNAFQANAFIDRLILLACLAAFVAAVATALLRSMGRRSEPPWNPAAIATVAGILATLMILYRMIQPPGFNEAAVVEPGVPVALVAVGILTVAARLATLIEREERLGPEAVAAMEAQGAERRARRRGRGSSGGVRAPRVRRARRAGAASSPSPSASAEPSAPSVPETNAPPAPGASAPPVPPAPEPEPERAPGSLWAPPPRDPTPTGDPFGPVEDPSAEAREERRRAREQARAARSSEKSRASRSGLGGAADSERREDRAVELPFESDAPDPSGGEDAPPEPPAHPPADR